MAKFDKENLIYFENKLQEKFCLILNISLELPVLPQHLPSMPV